MSLKLLDLALALALPVPAFPAGLFKEAPFAVCLAGFFRSGSGFPTFFESDLAFAFAFPLAFPFAFALALPEGFPVVPGTGTSASSFLGDFVPSGSQFFLDSASLLLPMAA